MGSLFFVSMLLFIITFTFFWILRLLFFLNYNESVVLKLSHFLIIESASLFLLLIRLIFISSLSLLIISGLIWSFVSLIRFIRFISLWSFFVSLFCHFSSCLRLNLGCILSNINYLILCQRVNNS